ncbi:hypothetical protein MAR_021884, partial [Mya arenaria]
VGFHKVAFWEGWCQTASRGEGSGPKWGRRINHSNFSLSELLLNASTPRREGSGSEKGRQKHHSNFSLLDLPHNVGTHPTQKKMLGVTRKLAPSPRVHVAGHDGHDGFELAAHARKTCRAEKFPSPGVILPAHLHTVASLRVVFCPMEKIASEMNPKPSDNHIISIRKGCKPCTSQFTYIGRMETFSSDAFFIMKKLGMNKTVERLQSSMKNLSIDDAITDSIRSPFEWKKDIRKFITWDQALQRIWLKLQMRGIIEFDIKLNMSSGQVDTVSEDEFINLARAAHKRSNADVLKKQKD